MKVSIYHVCCLICNGERSCFVRLFQTFYKKSHVMIAILLGVCFRIKFNSSKNKIVVGCNVSWTMVCFESCFWHVRKLGLASMILQVHVMKMCTNHEIANDMVTCLKREAFCASRRNKLYESSTVQTVPTPLAITHTRALEKVCSLDTNTYLTLVKIFMPRIS